MTDEELLTALRIKSEWVGSPSLYDVAADRLQALLTRNQKMREALEEIGKLGCETYNGNFSCVQTDRKKDAQCAAEKWCDACIANDGLGRETVRPLPKATI